MIVSISVLFFLKAREPFKQILFWCQVHFCLLKKTWHMFAGNLHIGHPYAKRKNSSSKSSCWAGSRYLFIPMLVSEYCGVPKRGGVQGEGVAGEP